MTRISRSFICVARRLTLLALWLASPLLHAITPEQLNALASGDNDAKLQAAMQLAAAGDEKAKPVLRALSEGALGVTRDNRVVIVGDSVTDALSGAALALNPAEVDTVTANNRLRKGLASALAAYDLAAPDRSTRLSAIDAIGEDADEALLPLLKSAAGKEADASVKSALELAVATIELAAAEPTQRLAAAKALGDAGNPKVKQLLLSRLEKQGDTFVEPDAAVRTTIEMSARVIEQRMQRVAAVGHVFSGLSLGSVLLLAALGLAITYGVMGVINMAHGEMLMIGAYATYVVQSLFRAYAPAAFDWYLIAAIPPAFCAAALVGLLLERSVIRWLYGRPLETLLATWGISLILMQSVRTMFGAQNVEVANPAWLSGGVEVFQGLVLPYSRIAIIAFTLVVLGCVAALMRYTRFGLFMRAVTQNRRMAGCVGVGTDRVDALAFAFGSGLAGLGGCALSQIGNVGPDLGQSYIVDSFMVVVLGGVGQLAGAVYAAFGLGIVNKFLEAWSGAVIAKIVVLLFIIVFIQKRPQGLFALKGRMAD